MDFALHGNYAFDRNRTFAYYRLHENIGVEPPSVKAFSAILILFVGLNLAATGLAFGLCTGRPGCTHCLLNAPAHSDAVPAGHGCCKPSTTPSCDVEKDSIPQRSFTHLPPLKQTLKRLVGIDNAAPGSLQAFDLNPIARTASHSAKTPHQKEPLYIQHLSLIC
jgi:hypothetical protein